MHCYNDTLDADLQVDAEEHIAALIFDRLTDADEGEGGSVTEQLAGDLGRDILKYVLSTFRPDLFALGSN